MNRRWYYLAIGALSAAILLSAWAHANRDAVRRQWELYCIGASANLEEAQVSIAWFEAQPDRDAKLGELVGNWQTGNGRFDLYLAEHVRSPAAADPLRAAFSHELGRRKPLLACWAHFWRFKAPMPPREQIDSILTYLGDRAKLDPPPPLTWREVLDLQAVWQTLDRPELAAGLRPDGWLPRWRQWQEVRPAELPEVARPESAF